MDVPIFSVIVPCYNQGQYLETSIESVCCQGFKSWELIVINDGSSDNTAEIIDKFSAKDYRIKGINQENTGLSGARNSGLKLAKGKYLIFLDSDDWLLSDCLFKFFELIRVNSKIQLFRCGYAYYDKYQSKIFHQNKPEEITELIPFILNQNIGPCHSIVIMADFAKTLGGFDESLKSCEDWDFWIRAVKFGAKLKSTSEVLVAYRFLPYSMSRNPKQMYEALLIVSERAKSIDSRISPDASLNRNYDLDFSQQAKLHFIKCLGVSLYQGKLEESITWHVEESEKYGWKFKKSDWAGFSSNLSYKYFLSSKDLEQVLNSTRPIVSSFLQAIGYSESEKAEILSIVFAPQLKKRNHLKYGRVIGGMMNKLGIWG